MIERSLRADVLQRRLALARRLLSHLATLDVPDGDALADDMGLRLQVERVLSELVEIAVHVNSHVVAVVRGWPPEDYRESFAAAAEAGLLQPDLAQRLAPSAGLRNAVVHDYLDIDLELLAASVPQALADYSAFVQQASAWLLEHQPGTGRRPDDT